jgi:hypothetical protein
MDPPQGTPDLQDAGARATARLGGVRAAAAGVIRRPGRSDRHPHHRLNARIKAVWRTTENNRRAKYYELTRAGRKQLEAATEDWRRLTAVVNQVLDLS